MDITTFIATLLNTENKVCIPGLGTISASTDAVKSDGEPGESKAKQAGQTEHKGHAEHTERADPNSFFPFLTGLSFSEKYDAGNRKLATMLAESRQINANMAGYEIDKFVIRAKQELSRNGFFELPEVGKLNLAPSGKIVFQSSLNDRALFGLSPLELKPVEHGNMVEVISRTIGFKNVGKNKFKLVWAILIGLIILALVSLLLVRLNMIGV